VAFGPRPRDFGRKVNRKVVRLAFQRALSEKVAKDQVKVLDSLELDEGKTREVAGLLKAIDVSGPVLVVVDTIDEKLERAARNVPDLELAAAAKVHVYDILRYPVLVTTREGFAVLKERLEGRAAGSGNDG
jgi:large subunit ribosomal protein L4